MGQERDVRIIRSYAPNGAVFTLQVMVMALKCIRRTWTAYARLERLASRGRCTAVEVEAEVRRQHAEDMPVRRRLMEYAEGLGWDAAGRADETRGALMTLLMALVMLDDRTEIEYERARGRSRRGRLRGLRKSFYDFIKRFKHGGD